MKPTIVLALLGQVYAIFIRQQLKDAAEATDNQWDDTGVLLLDALLQHKPQETKE